MQIREMDLKELFEAYELVRQLYTDLSYKDFEDLVYDMHHIEYKMFGLFERGELVVFAGAAIQTSLLEKRHLRILDFVTDEKQRFMGYAKLMLEFLSDYAKSAMCEKLVLSNAFVNQDAEVFYSKNGFEKVAYTLSKTL